MLLTFPDFDTLRLAITSGAVPDSLGRTAARAAFDAVGTVRVETGGTVTKTAQAALKRLGVRFESRSVGDDLPESVDSWPQLLPLERARDLNVSDRMAVLLELPDAGDVTEVVSEMLRLGNDRQSVLWLGKGAEARAWVRVIGPPYYTLLRAAEGHGSHRIRAYVEQADRVWVELGFVHPLGTRLKAPAGKMLLIGPPRDWRLLPAGQFQDVYGQLEFTLPDLSAEWQTVELPAKLRVSLKLVPSDSADPAELWVVSGEAVRKLEEFVQTADEQLLARLSFAVGQLGEETIVVLRARPGRSGPPVVVLEAASYRTCLKLPNLFVPCNARIQPPLRRDIVKSLLADDPQSIVWLQPGESGTFQPQSLPDGAFRPLSDWVDYVLDQSRQSLAEWMESMQFDFEPFIVSEGRELKQVERAAKPSKNDPVEPAVLEAPAAPDVTGRLKKPAKRQPLPPAEPLVNVPPDALRQEMFALEKELRQLSSPLDAEPHHRDVWIRLAQVNAALQRSNDAAICAGNALWMEGEEPPPEFWRWTSLPPGGGEIFPEWMDQTLTEPSPTINDIQQLVAHLASTLYDEKPSPALQERLGLVQQFLERNESHIGVRLLWLAWRAVFQQSQQDVLTLVRARDRVLERLFHNGLSPDLDLPAFLRYSGSELSDRMRVVREHLTHLKKAVGEWYHRNPQKSGRTHAYIDLIFAWGFAKLGESHQSRHLQSVAERDLADRDAVHSWLLSAFGWRIQQALEGKAGGQLPTELLEQLPAMEKMPRYTVDRLREKSRILEPVERFDPYRTWITRHLPPLKRELASLCDLLDKQELHKRLSGFLSQASSNPQEEAAVAATALELSPRLGDEFASRVLEKMPSLLSQPLSPLDRVRLLEKGLFVAAHFDHPAHVQDLIGRLRELLTNDLGSEVEKTLSSVLHQSFWGLRKLGMRDEILKLLEQTSARVTHLLSANSGPEHVVSGSLKGKTAGPPGAFPGSEESQVVPMKLHLQVASGWLYFGQEDRALPILDQARSLLMAELTPRARTDLACAYLATVGMAPAETAMTRMLDLFAGLDTVHDTFTTRMHYSQSQFTVIESAVTALVSDDIQLDKSGRRWLDDDEYLVRQRIHADIRAAVLADSPAD